MRFGHPEKNPFRYPPGKSPSDAHAFGCFSKYFHAICRPVQLKYA